MVSLAGLFRFTLSRETETEALLVVPKASLTVTEYVPLVGAGILLVVAPVDHEYEV
jgi:hypothetical protein